MAPQTTPYKKVAVGPKNTFTKDAQRGASKFDRWLRNISDGYVTLDRLAMAAGAIPVIGNAMAVVDTMLAIKDMASKKNTDMFDWMNLAINVIGIIPGTGNAARTTLRPTLLLVREQALRHKGLLTEAAVTAIANHILAGHKGDVEKYVAAIQRQMNGMLKEVSRHAQRTLLSSADALTKISSGKVFDTRTLHRKSSEAYNKGTVWTEQGRNLYRVAAGYKTEAVAKDVANAAVAKLVPPQIKTKLSVIAAQLHGYRNTVDARIMGLAGGLLKLLNLLLSALKKRKNISRPAAIPGKSQKTNQNARLDASTQQSKSKNKPSDCKSCGTGASRKSIDFATGQETFTHIDFSLPGIMPISWTRTYCSGLITYERGELGARWITPYTARIGIRKRELLYHTSDGRAVPFPLLEPGRAYHHPIEDFTLMRVSEDILTLNVGKDLLEIYERYGDVFRLLTIKDRNGNVLGFHYSGHLLVGINDTNNNLVVIHYNEQNKISRIELAGDNARLLVAYEYDHFGNLIKATDEAGDVYEYAYQDHLITRYTDRTGRGINLEWQGRRHWAKCIREYADDGSGELTLQWDENIRETIVTDAYGYKTSYLYDAENYTYRIIYPDHTEEWFFRDERKNITTHIHPDGSEDNYTYDDKDNLLEHIRADGSVVSFEYDADNNLTAITDPHNQRWLREYDSNGNMVRETDPEFNETRYVYDERGLPVRITDAKGGVKTLSWTADGQISSHTDCSGYTSHWAYDDRGRLTSQTDAEGHTTRYTYDLRGQLQTLSQADGTQEHYQYDPEGRLLEYTDPLAQSTRYTYDRAGRVFIRTDAADNRVQYRYDLNSRLTGLVDANGAVYGFRYNSVGALLEETGFDGKTTSYHYTEGSGVLREIHEADTITAINYDAAGRIESRSILINNTEGEAREADKENYSYDAAGRLVEARNNHSHYQYFYDTLGNLVKEYQHYRLGNSRRSYVWRHNYDELGNRIETIRPDGQRIGMMRYGSGHVHGLTLNQREITAYQRDRLHRETERTLGNKTAQHTRYDPLGRILQQSSNGSIRNYRYDKAGQLIDIQTPKGSIQYHYDPVGRLIAAITPNNQEIFAFDPAGNRLDTYKPADKAAEYPVLNKVWGNLLKEYAGTHYQYDVKGNLIEKTNNGNTSRYTWNGYNQLIKLENQTGITEYRYDALGRRIAKTHNGNTTVYLWQEDTLAVETNGDSSIHYIFEPDTFEPVAQFQTASVSGIPSPSRVVLPYSYDPEADPLLKEPKQPDTQPDLIYYRLDHLGTPIAATDEKGKTVWEATYKAWGEIEHENISDGLSINIPFRFQGQYYDKESGLHYNRFRYYDPSVGRFISQDPIGLWGGDNLYAYVDNPTGWIDPWGLRPTNSGRMPSHKVMPSKPGYQRQHIIPYSLKDHEVFLKSGMNINSASNLMYMPICEGIDRNPNLGLHRGWTQEHAQYNAKVAAKLDAIQARSKSDAKANKKWDYRNYQQEVQKLQRELRLGTQTGKYTCASPLNRKKK
ncbi:RHS repeat-associated core domain-containing protein [Neisseria dumasiana]|uniref:Sugar-binding protein n=1 Tax=Neisseria dumasiana TaxID=1931275 RepID=A0ABX3WI72_9NEIS|nr:RHS repeat-associated core domain-containing protein [Neisseria dumasiana]OSI28868.1 hypothetical protein BV913_11535 [Neisseria dumasiana]UOO85450.1 DUF6531 domain-containing protein [Neisseria dumasiana]